MPDSPDRNARPRLVLDCTHTFRTGAGTGIQRVVRHFSEGLLTHGAAAGFEVVPASLHASGAWLPIPVDQGRIAFPRAASAREELVSYDPPSFSLFHGIAHRANVLGSRAWRGWADAGPNAPGLRRTLGKWSRPAPPPGAITLRAGDILLSLDSSWVYDIRTALDRAGQAGAFRAAVVCDALSLTYPQWFSSGMPPYVAGWLAALLPRLDALVTISEATRDDIARVAASGILGPVRMPPSAAVHLGSDVAAGAQQAARELVRARIRTGRRVFLTVGTLEPRKNVGYALDIFERLLERGHDVEWHFIGAEGWLTGETIARITQHAEFGDRLMWWDDATDADLAWAYRHATALVAVSLAEGFGLPLVEARQAGLPVFATDIPVFREVLGAEGRYLPLGSAALAAAILEDFLAGALPVPARDAPSNVARSWDERSRELLDRVLEMRLAAPR